MACRTISGFINKIFKKNMVNETMVNDIEVINPIIPETKEDEETKPNKLIAPFIPALQIPISYRTKNPGVGINNHSLFRQLNPLPENHKFTIDSIDNIYGKYDNGITYDIIHVANGCAINLNANPCSSAKTGDVVLRINMKLVSDNYDDIKFTAFLVA